MKYCSSFEGSPAFTQCIFFQKLTVAATNALLTLCLCWASPWAHISGYLNYIWTARVARGRDCIRDNELDGKDWTSCSFHTDYFITECLFSIRRFTSFKSRHFKLSIDITPVSVLSICWVTDHFSDVFLKAVHGDREDRERTLFLFFFFKNHKVLLLLWVYAKVDT